MTIDDAIKKAIEGGWRKGDPSLDHYVNVVGYEAFLDPEFWKALGTAFGWGAWTVPFEQFEHEWEIHDYEPDTAKTPVYFCKVCYARKINDIIYWDGGVDGTEEWIAKPSRTYQMTSHKSRKLDDWKTHWHRLIDHIASGGSIESYFEGLK